MQVTRHASKWSTWALEPRADVTRSPKQVYQWPHEKNLSLAPLRVPSYQELFTIRVRSNRAEFEAKAKKIKRTMKFFAFGFSDPLFGMIRPLISYGISRFCSCTNWLLDSSVEHNYKYLSFSNNATLAQSERKALDRNQQISNSILTTGIYWLFSLNYANLYFSMTQSPSTLLFRSGYYEAVNSN